MRCETINTENENRYKIVLSEKKTDINKIVSSLCMDGIRFSSVLCAMRYLLGFVRI